MILGKLIVFGYSNRTEVIDLENPNNVCEDMAPNSNLLNHFSSGLINTNLPLVCGGRTKQQNETKCNKTNKTQQNTKIFVAAQQNNKIFCCCTTKQQNILFQHNKTTKYFVSPKTKQQRFCC